MMQIGRIRRETSSYKTLNGFAGKITTIYIKKWWGGWQQLLVYTVPGEICGRVTTLIDNRKTNGKSR